MRLPFSTSDPGYLCILFTAAASVYAVKAFKFYLLLIGEGIPLPTYIRAFAASTFVSIALPFKCGELFRFYTFGKLTRSYLKGLSIVLLDRFIDTTALLCMLVFLKLFCASPYDRIFILLMLAGGLLILCYLVMPGLLSFWNGYFIESPPSARHLGGLSLIMKMRMTYGEIQRLVRGRFFIAYSLSLLSWLLELGSLLACRHFLPFYPSSALSSYLSAALTGRTFAPQRNFVLASCLFLAAAYGCALLAQSMQKGGRHERR